MSKDFEAMVLEAAKKFFKSNKAMAKRLCDRASKINELKNKFKSSKAVATALNKVKKQGLPPNYAPPHKSVPTTDRELFIVEGDSAAGGFRKVRKKNQGLLPLSGKILNVLKAKGDKALVSKAIVNILGAMGFDPKASDPLAKLQIGKIVCLADPDPDGAHINCLLLTLFSTYLPGMFERGMIYIADMPEFYAIHKNQIIVGPTLSYVQKRLVSLKIKADVFHAKGWGEVDSQVLKILAVDDTRKLIKLQPITANDKSTFNSLMGKDEPVGAA
jgi:DNA gyrase subunit B